MKPIAEITERALARRMLAHVGSSWLDDDQGWPDDASEPYLQWSAMATTEDRGSLNATQAWREELYGRSPERQGEER